MSFVILRFVKAVDDCPVSHQVERTSWKEWAWEKCCRPTAKDKSAHRNFQNIIVSFRASGKNLNEQWGIWRHRICSVSQRYCCPWHKNWCEFIGQNCNAKQTRLSERLSTQWPKLTSAVYLRQPKRRLMLRSLLKGNVEGKGKGKGKAIKGNIFQSKWLL